MRIKWPNDVYADVGSAAEEQAGPGQEGRKGTFEYLGRRYAKMAGVLVNSQFAGKELALVVGEFALLLTSLLAAETAS